MRESRKFNIKVADRVVSVKALSDSLKDFMADYVTEDMDADFSVELKQTDLDYENEVTIRFRGHPAFCEKELEQLALLRRLTDIFVSENIILMHGVALEYEGEAYLFTALSGVGKTTHSVLWEKMYEDKVTIINGDKPFLELHDEGVTVWGSPWGGKEGKNTNTSAPLVGIACLKRCDRNYAESMSSEEKWDFLMNQMYKHRTGGLLVQSMDILKQIIEDVPVFRLYCNMEEDAAAVSLDAFRNNKDMK